jgi:hypothetical protein
MYTNNIYTVKTQRPNKLLKSYLSTFTKCVLNTICVSIDGREAELSANILILCTTVNTENLVKIFQQIPMEIDPYETSVSLAFHFYG